MVYDLGGARRFVWTVGSTPRRVGEEAVDVLGHGDLAQRIRIFAAAKIAHLSDDETIAKMGHPIWGLRSDVATRSPNLSGGQTWAIPQVSRKVSPSSKPLRGGTVEMSWGTHCSIG